MYVSNCASCWALSMNLWTFEPLKMASYAMWISYGVLEELGFGSVEIMKTLSILGPCTKIWDSFVLKRRWILELNLSYSCWTKKKKKLHFCYRTLAFSCLLHFCVAFSHVPDTIYISHELRVVSVGEKSRENKDHVKLSLWCHRYDIITSYIEYWPAWIIDDARFEKMNYCSQHSIFRKSIQFSRTSFWRNDNWYNIQFQLQTSDY